MCFTKLFERIQAIEDDLDPKRTGKVFNVLGRCVPRAISSKKCFATCTRTTRWTEELIKQRIVEQVDTERLKSITNSTLEGLASADLPMMADRFNSRLARPSKVELVMLQTFGVHLLNDALLDEFLIHLVVRIHIANHFFQLVRGKHVAKHVEHLAGALRGRGLLRWPGCARTIFAGRGLRACSWKRN